MKITAHVIIISASALILSCGLEPKGKKGKTEHPKEIPSENQQEEPTAPAPQPEPMPEEQPAPPAPTTAEQPPSPTYSSTIQGLIEQNCQQCHTSFAAPSLATFENVDASKSAVVQAVESGTMPPQGPLAPEIVAEFVKWRDAGYPK
jgi:hypothetical protein